MASNKELCSEIVALCEKRGVAIPDDLDRLKQPKLLELLATLNEQTPDAPPSGNVVETTMRPLVAPSPPETLDDSGGSGRSAHTGIVEPTAPQVSPGPQVSAAAPPAPPQVSTGTGAPGYFVAERKVVRTRGEPKGAFEQVTLADLPRGQAELDELLAAGTVFKR